MAAGRIKRVIAAKCRSHWLESSKGRLSRHTGYEEHQGTAKLITADLKEWCSWRWLCVYRSRCLFLSDTHTHRLEPALNYCPRRLETKWIMPSWSDKNWAAWSGSCWAARMGPYGGARPAPICQLRLFMRRCYSSITWSSWPSSNYASRDIIRVFLLPAAFQCESECRATPRRESHRLVILVWLGSLFQDRSNFRFQVSASLTLKPRQCEHHMHWFFVNWRCGYVTSWLLFCWVWII